MTEEPEKLPDGRIIERVPAKLPLPLSQPFQRIALIQVQLDSANNIHQVIMMSQQLAHALLKGAKEARKYKTSDPENDVYLEDIAEEMEITSALAAKLCAVVKGHRKETDEHAKIRGLALEDLAKACRNTGSSLREYLLALADQEKAKSAT